MNSLVMKYFGHSAVVDEIQTVPVQQPVLNILEIGVNFWVTIQGVKNLIQSSVLYLGQVSYKNGNESVK